MLRLGVVVVMLMSPANDGLAAQQVGGTAPVRRLRDGIAQLLPGGFLEETVWNRPEFLIADSVQVCAVDFGDVAVSCADWNGSGFRRLGRLGQGPGEYIDARSVQLYRGSIMIHDGQLRRAVWFTRDGAYRDHAALREHFGGIVPEGPGGYWAVPTFGAGLLVRLDSSAKAIGQIPRPQSLIAADPIAMQFSVLRLDSTHVLLASRTNGRFYRVNTRSRELLEVAGASTQSTMPALSEKVRLPDGSSDVAYRPSKLATYTSLALVRIGERLLVVGGSAEPMPFRLIDVYAAGSLTYLCSFALPRAVHGLAVDPRGILLAIHWSPEPHLARYRLDLPRCS